MLVKLQTISRRVFIKVSILITFLLLKKKISIAKEFDKKIEGKTSSQKNDAVQNLGIDKDGKSKVYISRGLEPEENVKKAVELFGGIDKIVDKNDIIIIKPNAQWWNQGTTNTNNIKGFIELVLSSNDFKGEIIIAENHHYKKANSRGWTTDQKNGDFNLNQLVQYFNNKGIKNVSKYHWIDGGPNPQPQEGDAGGGNVVNSVEAGDGYVWLKDSIYLSPENRKCMMTYPVFTSQYSKEKIDLMKGCYKNKIYQNNIKLINFACLNHHSYSFGVTASIKNIMGIVDMTCGFQGTTPKGYYNTHFIGKRSFIYQLGVDLKYYGKRFKFGTSLGNKVARSGYWNSHFTGAALGFWMKNVRMPDINILAAENVGWGGRGRSGPQKMTNSKCVAISKDPVALDYIGAKHILLGATPEQEHYYKEKNNPDNPPFSLFLEQCHNQGIGNLLPEFIEIVENT